MTYVDGGQLGPIIRWGDGSIDAPASVLVICEDCGAAVLLPMTDLHTATHTAEVTE